MAVLFVKELGECVCFFLQSVSTISQLTAALSSACFLVLSLWP